MEAGNADDGGNVTDSNFTDQNLFRSECVIGTSHSVTVFLVAGVGILLVDLVGIIGNILALIVLTRPRMRTSSTNVILIFLAISDLVFVIVNLLLHGLPVLFGYLCFWRFYEDVIVVVSTSYLYGMINAAQVGSIYFTVGVSVERLIVVYRPLLARSVCTVRNALRASLALASFVILYTLPYWFIWTYDVIYEEDYDEPVFESRTTEFYNEFEEDYDEPVFESRTTEFYNEFESAFYYYEYWGDVLVVRLIPFTLLVTLNLLIFYKMRQANRQRMEMTQGQGRGSGANEISVTKMLLWIVTIFIVCNSVKVYLILVSIFELQDYATDETYAIAALLLNLNSAVNIFVYCFVGTKFRQTFLQTFCIRSNRTPSHSTPAIVAPQLINNEVRSRNQDTGTAVLPISAHVEVIPMQQLCPTAPLDLQVSRP